MKNQLLLLFTICFLALLCALQGCDSGRVKTGPATAIQSRQPIDILCEIRENFKRLHLPVFTKIIYHKPWQERRFPDQLIKHGKRYTIVLTPESTEFIRTYAALELLVALSPLIVDEEYGVDVVALFDGMQPDNKLTGVLGFPAYLVDKYRTIPAVDSYIADMFSYIPEQDREDNEWWLGQESFDYFQRLRFLDYLPHYIYSHCNVRQSPTPASEKTLAASLCSIVKEHYELRKKENSPYFRPHDDWIASPDLILDRSKVSNLVDVLKGDPVFPAIGPGFTTFISHHDRSLLSLVLLGLDDFITLGAVLGLHRDYWLFYSADWKALSFLTNKSKTAYIQDFKSSIVKKLVGLCVTE